MKTPLEKPLSTQELIDRKDENGFISENLVVPFFDLIDCDLETLNDEVSERITGSDCGLLDIEYRAIGITPDNEIIVEVTGNVQNWLDEEMEDQ